MIDDIKGWLTNAASGLVRAVGEASESIQLVNHPKGNGSIGLVRDGYTVHLLPGAEKAARRHLFDDLPSFAEWLRKHADPKRTEILFARDGRVVAALAPDRVHTDLVACKLEVHPRLARWLKLFKLGGIAQRDLHRHIVGALEDFPELRGEDGTVLGSSGSHLAGQLLKIEVVKNGNLTVQLDELGFTRLVSSSSETSVTAKLPGRFPIRVPWFLGAKETDEYAVEVLLAVNAGERCVAFELAAPALDVVQHQALADAVDFLRSELGEEWLVGLGTLTTVTVPLLDFEE